MMQNQQGALDLSEIAKRRKQAMLQAAGRIENVAISIYVQVLVENVKLGKFPDEKYLAELAEKSCTASEVMFDAIGVINLEEFRKLQASESN